MFLREEKMRAARVSTWNEAKELGLREAEKKLGRRIEKHWVDSIRLEQEADGNYWTVRLELQVGKSLGKKTCIHASMKIDPFTGEVRDFQAKEC